MEVPNIPRSLCKQLIYILLPLHFRGRELNSRVDSGFHENFVIGVLRCHDGDEDERFAGEIKKKGYAGYLYCLVMPAAERNLANILAHEHIAGKDWRRIRQLTEELVEAVTHVHSKGILHGDLKREFALGWASN